MGEGSERRRCELCKMSARVFCAADEANLCWECDAQVHGANFLVARHVRSMLCDTCGAPTEWMKSGFRVDPKVPFCQYCFYETNHKVDFGRDDAESKIASSESSVISHSCYRCGVREGHLKIRGDKEAQQAEVMGKDGMGCVSKSRRKGHSVADASNSRGNSQRAQPSRFVNQPDAGDAKRHTELCCKDWSVALSSCVDIEDESSCESNELQLPAKRSYSGQTPTLKRMRKHVSKQVESGLDTSSSHASENAANKNVVTRTKKTKKVKESSMQRSATAYRIWV